MPQGILVTGGAGFIGSHFVRMWLERGLGPLVNVDKLTYAASLDRLEEARENPLHRFLHADCGDLPLMEEVLDEFSPWAVIHFAALTHVDKSIAAPLSFLEENTVATSRLLEASHRFFRRLPEGKKSRFRFLLVSTDEVYGSLSDLDPPLAEGAPYAPSSPYSASKAAADHFAQAYFRTYGLPILITHAANNYGPGQHEEKLIPTVILSAARQTPIGIYGDGKNKRDWLYVRDHGEALMGVLFSGRPGESYHIGAGVEKTNIEVVQEICAILDRALPQGASHLRHLTFVADRPGHDRRYAMRTEKIRGEIGWRPKTPFSEGLAATVHWYLNQQGILPCNH